MIDVMREMMQNPEEARSVHLSDIDNGGEQENLDDQDLLQPMDTTELPEEEAHNENIKSDQLDFSK